MTNTENADGAGEGGELKTVMVILDRLHRGDSPHYRPVCVEQSDGICSRIIFDSEESANAFIRAYSRSDRAASFRLFTVPTIGLRAYWHNCRDHDWHYSNSDDNRVWREGGAVANTLSVQATISREHRMIYLGWKRHRESGPAYKTEQTPPPLEPTLKGTSHDQH